MRQTGSYGHGKAGCGSRQKPYRPGCVPAAHLPPWACLPRKTLALRVLETVPETARLYVHGRQTRVFGKVVQEKPIQWILGGRTRVAVRVETRRSWIRGTIPAAHLLFVLKKGTRLFAGPTGPLAGILTGNLEVSPLRARKDRVSFKYEVPVASPYASPVFWVRKSRFRIDAKPRRVPPE